MRICKWRLFLLLSIVLDLNGLIYGQPAPGPASKATLTQPMLRSFSARGIVRRLEADGRSVLIEHEAITNYMDAMTMPFRASEPGDLRDLRPGDEISFRLLVSDSDSWIDRIART